MIPGGLVKAKAIFYVKTDVEGRRLRARTGLVTLVVYADNYECYRLDIKFSLVMKILSISPQE